MSDLDSMSQSNLIKLGYAAINSLEVEKASSIFQYIIEKFPEQPSGYCGLGIAHYRNKKYEKAKDNLKKTLELDINYKIAQDFLDKIT